MLGSLCSASCAPAAAACAAPASARPCTAVRPLPCAWAARPAAPRGSVVARAGEGVKDLLSRDRKQKSLENNPFASPEEPEEEDDEVVAEEEEYEDDEEEEYEDDEEEEEEEDPYPELKTCGQAIAAGLEAFQADDFEEAVDIFRYALELPGNGFMRLEGTVREYACPSEAEEHAALYNMACAYCKMGEAEAAFQCIETILESGFEDYNTLRTDPDLKPIQGPKLEEALQPYDGMLAKVGLFSKKKKPEKKSDGIKWFTW